MKKIFILFIAFTMLICCFGCAGKTDEPQQSEDIQTSAQPKDTQNNTNTDGIDVDLTKMNSTMVYNAVYDMVVTAPENYIGKTVRMKGVFNASYYEPTDNYYYYVIISDATACCAQGIEFIWKGDHSFPNDYPQNGEEIVVTGVFGQYEELGVTYNYVLTDGIELAGA